MMPCKRYGFICAFLIAITPLIGWMLGGWYLLLPYLSAFAFVPFIDILWFDADNPNNDEAIVLESEPFFKWLCLLYVPFFAFLLLAGIHYAPSSSWPALLSHTFISGIIAGGLAITVAHELMHKSSKIEQLASRILMTLVTYGHFVIEHVRGHHVRVATPEDPASARYGESIYQFWPRSLWGGLVSAWHLEKKRMNNAGHSVWYYKNEFYWIILIPVMIGFMVYWYGGVHALVFYFGQGILAFLTLEVVNYIEHYGLVRKKLPNGRYEPFNYQHAWNSGHGMSNLFLFHLQRHPDHHIRAAVRYQNLKHMPESPQLPMGYPGMYLLAMVPALWKKVMHKRIAQYQQNNAA